MSYTFGDNDEASRRLRRLAEVYEPETRALLNSAGSVSDGRFELGVDLGCGPGWSTLLIAVTVNPVRMIGLDSSERFGAEARSNQPQLEFTRHDVLVSPFPVHSLDRMCSGFPLSPGEGGPPGTGGYDDWYERHSREHQPAPTIAVQHRSQQNGQQQGEE
jgi:trans-aconitate 2-methyltransferase